MPAAAGRLFSTQRCPYAPKLLGELVACVENALPLPRERLAIALVGRQDALGQSEQLRLVPGGLLVLSGLQALCRPFAVFGGLDGLAGQGVVSTGGDGPVQQNACVNDQVVVGCRLRKRCLDREISKDDIGPAGQGSCVRRLAILLPKSGQTLLGCTDQFVSGVVGSACLGELKSGRCLAERLDVQDLLWVLRPARRHRHEIGPACFGHIADHQAGELLGEREVEFVAVGKVAAGQDRRLGGHERMRRQQIADGVAVAAQHLEAQQIVVGRHLQGELVRRRELQAVQLRQCESQDLGGAGVVSAVSHEFGAQPQELEAQRAVRRNCVEQRVCGSQQPQRALGIVVLCKLTDDPDEETRRVRAARACQGKGGDECLVDMIA